MLKMQLSWVTGVSNYFMQLEKLVYAAIGILILAVVSLQQPLPFIVKVALFIAYSIALFRIQLIAGFFFKRQPVEATSEDQELLKAIEASEFTLPPCVSIVVTPSEIRNWRQLSNYETLLT